MLTAAKRFLNDRRSQAAARFAELRAKIMGRQALHFVHVGKTGGSAVKHSLKGFESSGDYQIFLHEHAFRLKMLYEGELAFFFLRDPLDRFVSGFNSRKRMGRPRYHYPWTAAETIAFERFSDPDSLGCALSSSVPELRAAAEHAMVSIQHVKDSYNDLFGGIETLQKQMGNILFVGFHDKMERDFTRLLGMLGLPDSIQLPTDSIASHRSVSSSWKPLSSDAEEALRQWYAKDYEIYESLREAFR